VRIAQTFIACAGLAGIVSPALLATTARHTAAQEAAIALPSSASVAIAPLDEALTFARARSSDGTSRTLLVLRYAGGSVEGIDLSVALGRPVDDPIEAYRSEGYAALRALALRAEVVGRVVVPADTLGIPVDLGRHHIAAGTNYPEHAGEAGVEDGPFLFAKLVEPTAPDANVSAGKGLLDYEVELAWVTLEDVREGKPPKEMGLILSNDYTDRDTLLHHVDVADVASGKGFTTGKSFPGYLPVGDLFVIPRDYRAFADARELRLSVNGEPRQKSLVSAQVWGIDEIFAEAWKRRDQRWEHRGEQVSLFADGDIIKARTLLMSGTPAGTVFQNVGTSHKLRGVASWVLGGFRVPVATAVVHSYVADPAVRATYLQPGDRVTIRVDYLGTIDNEIVR
jgi:2-keto-4-pentenoate hydratase/2-oxohepta-3-ene-1,7-dioic acid hydratase in catechol pathway